MKLLSIFAIFFISLTNAFSQTNQKISDTINIYNIHNYDSSGKWQTAEKVTVSDLVKNPNKYKSKLVCVYGFASIKFDDAKIYGSEKSYLEKNDKDAILYYQAKEDTHLIMKKFNLGYAEITGLFYTIKDKECDGVIFQIRRIDISK